MIDSETLLLIVSSISVVREPPYIVKESGYAGFNFPIDIYLRNSGEPKKIKFNYDLNLQQSGPAILKVQKEKYVFSSLNEDFKHRLLKGGGVVSKEESYCNDKKQWIGNIHLLYYL